VADSATGGIRVLVVEDEALVRLMLSEMLNELGHKIVAEASRLDAAVRIASEADYELAVLDLNLGTGITYDVVEIVLGRGKAVVLTTGYGQAGLVAKYSSCVVVQKPFSRDTIGRAIQLSLRHLNLSQSLPGARSR